MLSVSHPLILDSHAELRDVLFNAMADGVMVANDKGVILDCNPAFHLRLGYTREEMIGYRVTDLDPPEYAALVPQRFAQILANGQATFETAHYRKDGTVMPVELTSHHCQVGGDTVFFAIVRDLTERKKLESQLRESFQTYEAAINTPAMGFWVLDMQGNLLEANDAYARQSGYSREELRGMAIPDLDPMETPEETRQRIEHVKTVGYDRFRKLQRRKDGSLWPVEVVTSYSPVHGGRFFVFFEDISEKLHQENQRKLSELVFDSIEQAVVVSDADNRIISINPAATRITGYSFEDVVGKNPKIFSSGRHDKTFYREMWTSLTETGRWEGEIWDRRKDGAAYLKWMSINTILDDSGAIKQYVSVFSDITERKRAEQIIWNQANFDQLTGLANRVHFRDQIRQKLNQDKRRGQAFAVLYLDLDGFKDVNDLLGHAGGDLLLMEVANRLRQRVRNSDTVARLGGDEFTMLVGDIANPDQVGSLAEEILTALREPVFIDGSEIRIGGSIGVAFYPNDGDSVDAIFKHADIAMYQAKQAGRNTFKFFHPDMNASALNRLALIRDLHDALESQTFQIHYQPIFRLADGGMIGMEALIRWPRFGKEMTPPSAFIPHAEEAGLIHAIGQWVLDEACRQASGWRSRFGRDLKLSINLSAKQLYEPGLVAQILETLAARDWPPHLLELEVTEGILMHDVEQAITVMQRLQQQGISIAIDDFGTGYSSFNYLKRFPINTLKIDRSFVYDLTTTTEDAAICCSIVTLAKSLRLDVVAEGVETAEQEAFLKATGCLAAQGYHLARPMPADQLEHLLLESST
ncbi:bifunctional diguanylate cyclase/phosphodiesterase [Magnetospira thiophila]